MSTEQIGKTASIIEAEVAVHAGPSHVRVDQQHLGAAVGQRCCQIARRGRLAFERLCARHQDDAAALSSAQGD
jgi:hypothetical protein